MSRPGFVVLIGALLFASALSLITAQHRSRSLFIDLQRAQGDELLLGTQCSRREFMEAIQDRLLKLIFASAGQRKKGGKSGGGTFFSEGTFAPFVYGPHLEFNAGGMTRPEIGTVERAPNIGILFGWGRRALWSIRLTSAAGPRNAI